MNPKQQEKYLKVYATIKDIIQKAMEMENNHERDLALVHPIYKKSAANLLHYLAFRSFDIDKLQSELIDLGFSSL
jgi:pyruvate kinase